MAKENRTLSKPERCVVVEISDVVPRRVADKPNVFVTTTRLAPQANKRLIQQFKKRKNELRRNALRVLTEFDTPQTFTESKKLTAARDALAAKLSELGYTVNPDSTKKFRLYVIELEQAIWKKDSRVPLYVGMSSKQPAERIKQHRSDYLASKKVAKHFKVRREELEPKALILHSSYDAATEETALGNALTKAGYKVFGPQKMQKGI